MTGATLIIGTIIVIGVLLLALRAMIRAIRSVADELSGIRRRLLTISRPGSPTVDAINRLTNTIQRQRPAPSVHPESIPISPKELQFRFGVPVGTVPPGEFFAVDLNGTRYTYRVTGVPLRVEE